MEDKIGAIQGIGGASSAGAAGKTAPVSTGAAASQARPSASISTNDDFQLSSELLDDLQAVSDAGGEQGGHSFFSGGGQGAAPGISSPGTLTSAGGYQSNQPPGMSVAGVHTTGHGREV